MKYTPKSYVEFDKLLTGRCKKRRNLSRDVWAVRNKDTIFLEIDGDRIFAYMPNGDIILKTDGQRSNRLVVQINKYIPNELYVWSQRKQFIITGKKYDFKPMWVLDETPVIFKANGGIIGKTYKDQVKENRAEGARKASITRKANPYYRPEPNSLAAREKYWANLK